MCALDAHDEGRGTDALLSLPALQHHPSECAMRRRISHNHKDHKVCFFYRRALAQIQGGGILTQAVGGAPYVANAAITTTTARAPALIRWLLETCLPADAPRVAASCCCGVASVGQTAGRGSRMKRILSIPAAR